MVKRASAIPDHADVPAHIVLASAARGAARALRAEALRKAPGDRLGSEEELLERHGVSRPTLRQAAALLVQEQLLLIKRGVNGGYYVRRPDGKGVAHTAAIYLQSRETSLGEILQAVLPIKVEMAVLACRSRDQTALKRLRQFHAQQVSAKNPNDYRAFLRSELEFGALLGELCANNVLVLFLLTLYDYCASVSPEEDIYLKRPDRIEEYWTQRNRVIEAVLNRDEELAATFARRCALLAAQWMGEDLGRRNMARPFTELSRARTSGGD